MHIEQLNNSLKHDLAPYLVTVIQDPEMLGSIFLEIQNKLKIIVSVKIEENKELDSTFELTIKSKVQQLETVYLVYTNQINRIISEVVFLNKYKKTRFIFTITLIEVYYNTDVLCHIINALMLTIMLSKIEMKYFPISSTCFIDDTTRLYTEDEANQMDTKLTQVYLCKKLSNDDEIVSFKISGGHIDDKHIDRVFSYLCGSANTIGRKLLEFTHSWATK